MYLICQLHYISERYWFCRRKVSLSLSGMSNDFWLCCVAIESIASSENEFARLVFLDKIYDIMISI